MRGYIAQLERMTEAANAANTATASKPANPPYTPLPTQLQDLFATMTENQRNRDHSVAELIPRLKGQFRSAPSAAKVASALKQLGFTQHRDYSQAGGGARTWRRV